MSDTSVLNRMIDPEAKTQIDTNNYNKKTVVLQEQQEPDSRIKLCNIPDDTIIINLDEYFACDKLFHCNEGECKRADYLIISEQKKRIIFIEMKKTKAIRKEVIKQLKGSLCAFEYLQAIAREFFKEINFVTIQHTS